MKWAEIYDYFMDEQIYDEWKNFVKRTVSDSQKTLLDLASGTGKLTFRLLEAGYTVTGLDVSSDMLSLCYNEQLRRNIFFPLIEADMRNLEDAGTYDLVTCSLDALCYFREKEDVRQTFNEVYRHLNKGGLFLFDVHSLYKMEEVFPGYQFHGEMGEDVFLWSAFEGKRSGEIEHYFDLFEHETGRTYKRSKNLIIERSFPIEDYVVMLEESGFINIEITENYGLSPVQEKTERVFFICEKGD